ncbi:MAG: efflux transporter outer membrane subunit [Pseudomonadota bacterium]
MRRNPLLAVIAAAALAGCVSLAPGYQRPAAELPAVWRDAPANGMSASRDQWWTLFGDPVLDRLVAEALAHNQDLALAAARVDEARALLQVADAEQVPAIDASAQRDRTRLFSERSSTPFPLPPGTRFINNNNRATLNVSYELDLWGRLRNASDAARAELLASRAARDTVRITLAAQVAQSYFQLTALDAQAEATRRSLEFRMRDLELQKVRNASGLIGDFDLRQREAEVASARAQLPELERLRATEELALAVLLGRSPRDIIEGGIQREADRGEPPIAVVPEGLPSELLLRRPDLVEAEQRLIAANARIGVARASLFPRISLTGYLGSESGALSDLFTGPAGVWQLAAALSQPIFQGGRLFGEIDATRARERQAVARYRKAIQEAFKEVRQALVAQARSREVFDAEADRIKALNETLRLARIRYDLGISSQLELLDAERGLLQAEINRVEALRAQRNAVTDLVRALGGGWDGLPQDAGGPVAQAAPR